MPTPCKVAYLVNQYPKVSHSFIRREIAAVEASGIQVERYSIRPTRELLPDAADERENGRTHALLGAGAGALLFACAAAFVRRPVPTLKALGLALRLGRGSEQGLLRHLIYLAEAGLLLAWTRRDGCAHVHAHFGTNSTTVAMLCRALGGPPFSFTVHGPEEFDKTTAIALGAKLRAAHFVAAISEFGRAQLLRLCEVAAWDKVHIVPCGVEGALLEGEPPPVPAAPRLVCVGRLCPEKAQTLLVEAAAILRQEGVPVELVLVGDGEMRGAIEQAIARHRLGDGIRITGWVSNERVREELVAARAMVLPSFAEGLPVVIMEAFALGRPVVSTYVAGIPELVEPGRTGWLCPAGSVSGLVGAMRAVLQTSPEVLTRMGRQGRERVRQGHDVGASGGKLAQLFRGVAAP